GLSLRRLLQQNLPKPDQAPRASRRVRSSGSKKPLYLRQRLIRHFFRQPVAGRQCLARHLCRKNSNRNPVKVRRNLEKFVRQNRENIAKVARKVARKVAIVAVIFPDRSAITPTSSNTAAMTKATREMRGSRLHLA